MFVNQIGYSMHQTLTDEEDLIINAVNFTENMIAMNVASLKNDWYRIG